MCIVEGECVSERVSVEWCEVSEWSDVSDVGCGVGVSVMFGMCVER